MGQAKHKRSRCTCNRIGSRHKDGCPALNPPPTTEAFVLTLDKEFADTLMQYHRIVREVEPSPGAFIVRMLQRGLDSFIAEIEAAEKKDRIVTLAGPGDLAKLGKVVEAR